MNPDTDAQMGLIAVTSLILQAALVTTMGQLLLALIVTVLLMVGIVMVKPDTAYGLG